MKRFVENIILNNLMFNRFDRSRISLRRNEFKKKQV